MARRLGVPVDTVFDRFTPEQFDELIALERLEGDPDARLREILKRGFAVISLAQIDPEDLDPIKRRSESAATVSPRRIGELLKTQFQGG